MTYSGGQRGKAKPRSERESPLQSLLGMMFPSGTGRPAMDRRTPLERAPVGTPMILGGQLGYKGIKQSGEFKGAPTWIKRQDMESENIPTYDPSTQQYIYAAQPAVTPIVTGLTPTGQVDRTQSDEYKATRARYDQLRKAGPEMVMTPEGLREKALDYGLQEWAKMYPQLAAKQEAAKYGTFNPLMQQTFGYQTGEAPDQVQRQMMIGGQRYDVDPEAIQYQIDQQRAQRDMESPDPLMHQKIKQEDTAAQADKATTAGMSALNRTDQFLTEFGPFFTPEQTGVKFPDPSGRTPGINPNPFTTRILK
jgi:hypothetical protein